MASDEGVLSRSTGQAVIRDPGGVLDPAAAKLLYRIHRFERDGATMHLLFRDHSLSDLIGFVYSGMPPADAAKHFLDRVHACAAPVLAEGRDAVVPVILDGENCWEYYPQSGREFLRQLYSAISKDPQIDALTFREAIAKTPDTEMGRLEHITPGSWINANFDIWIGSDEDRRSWDLLSEARDFYSDHADNLPELQRKLAYEELLIAQGSDWNWWYGPEHHSANDADFDELYRKHLSNMYQALGAVAPDDVGRAIATAERRSLLTPQSAHVRPSMDGHGAGFFDWMGAAHCRADRRQSAMHGKQFLLDIAYAGQDDKNLYLRLDFNAASPTRAQHGKEILHGNFDVLVNLERHREGQGAVARRLTIKLREGLPVEWDLAPYAPTQCLVRMGRVLVTSIPLEELQARRGDEVRVTFSLWQDGVPVDSLPDSGWMHLRVMSHDDLRAKQAGEEWVV
jgi:hypothetical protein